MTESQELTKESHARFLNSTIECIKYFQKADEYIEKQTAENFTPFSYIPLNENMSSAILKDFLDPKGKHGQGTLFLEYFLEKFFPENSILNLKKAKAQTEVATCNITASKRRIDILITFPNAIIAIENKLWAKDQSQQVEDYLKHIEHESLRSSKKYHLLYLSPLKDFIPDESLSTDAKERFKEHYSTIKWEDVLEVLEKSASKAPPEKLRVFIKDFSKKVRHELWGG